MKCSSRLDTAEDILLECIDWKNLRWGSSFIAERFQNSHVQRSFLRISLLAALIIGQWIVSVAKNVLNNSRVLKLPTGAPEAKSKMLRQSPFFYWHNMMQYDAMILLPSRNKCQSCWNSHDTWVSPPPIRKKNARIWYTVMDASAILKTCCKILHQIHL